MSTMYRYRITEIKIYDVIAESEEDARDVFNESGGDEYYSCIENVEQIEEVDF